MRRREKLGHLRVSGRKAGGLCEGSQVDLEGGHRERQMTGQMSVDAASPDEAPFGRLLLNVS